MRPCRRRKQLKLALKALKAFEAFEAIPRIVDGWVFNDVLRHPTDLSQDVQGALELQDALQASSLPMLVDVYVWSRLPEAFHANIEAAYVVVQ